MEFQPFPKIPRFNTPCVVTEKIDGTNASVFIGEDGEVLAASRNRWLQESHDNYGFWKWVQVNKAELLKLGPGHHFGEWWGVGIQAGYNLFERRFSLFNTKRWLDDTVRPACCRVVPILWEGLLTELDVPQVMAELAVSGSKAAPGWMKPEGIVIYNRASNSMFKCTYDFPDGKWKEPPVA